MAEERKQLARGDVTLSYRVSGQGPPVLLIQGVGVVGQGWRPQVEGLSRRHALLTFDNRGIGASSPCRGPISIRAMAEDALALLEAEGWEKAHVVGHSMGGLVAQELALLAPERVRSLALLCTFARGKQGARPSLGVMLTGIRTRIGRAQSRREAFLSLVLPPALWKAEDLAAWSERLQPLFGHDLASQPPVSFRQLRAMARYEAGPRLRELSVIPTLVLSGALDRIAQPRFGEELAAAIPGARFVVWEGAAHGLPIYDAVRVNELLADHFAQA